MPRAWRRQGVLAGQRGGLLQRPGKEDRGVLGQRGVGRRAPQVWLHLFWAPGELGCPSGRENERPTLPGSARRSRRTRMDTQTWSGLTGLCAPGWSQLTLGGPCQPSPTAGLGHLCLRSSLLEGAAWSPWDSQQEPKTSRPVQTVFQQWPRAGPKAGGQPAINNSHCWKSRCPGMTPKEGGSEIRGPSGECSKAG